MLLDNAVAGTFQVDELWTESCCSVSVFLLLPVPRFFDTASFVRIFLLLSAVLYLRLELCYCVSMTVDMEPLSSLSSNWSA